MMESKRISKPVFHRQMHMARRSALMVAFHKHHGLPDRDTSEPTAPLLSSRKQNQEGVICGRKDEKYYTVSAKKKKTPVPVDILNNQDSLTLSLTATHYREYSKSLSTHLS